MRMKAPLRLFVFQAVLLSLPCAAIAQGHHDHDRDNPGHGGMPPGQAKKYGYEDRGMPPGQARKYGYDDRSMPPGQARKYADFRFRDEDRDRFYAHYRHDADGWRHRHRPVFVPGEYIDREYVVRPVPRTWWVGVEPPPPPGYLYGYCGGYIVAYNPTTRIVADVLDLIDAARSR